MGDASSITKVFPEDEWYAGIHKSNVRNRPSKIIMIDPILEIDAKARQVATQHNQLIGERNDLYITLWQLTEILKSVQVKSREFPMVTADENSEGENIMSEKEWHAYKPPLGLCVTCGRPRREHTGEISYNGRMEARNRAINVLELTKGFTPEQRRFADNAFHTMKELAGDVLRLTADVSVAEISMVTADENSDG